MLLKYCIVTYFFSIALIFPQNRWQFVNPTPTEFNLFDVANDLQNNYWIFGEFGTILKSTNNCSSWETVELNYYEDLYYSEILNNKMWVVGQEGLILFSENYGSTWNKQTSNTKKRLKKIKFFDESHGWIMASDSLVLRTVDGGNNWQHVLLNNKWHQNDIAFIDKDIGFLLTGYFRQPNLGIDPSTDGEFLKTEDGGITWSKIDSGKTKYSSIFFLNDQIGLMSVFNYGHGRFFLKSTDSGNSWDTLSQSYDWAEMNFINERDGIAANYNYIGKTTDGGYNWEIIYEINTPSPSSRITSIYSNNQNLLAVGTEGNIIKSDDYGNSWDQLNSSIDFYYAALKGVTFLNQNEGFIYGSRLLGNSNNTPIFLSTTDGGENWNNLPSPDSNSISILKEFNNKIWVSSSTKLYNTENNGTDWNEIIDVADNNDEQIRDIYLFDNNHLVFLAGRRVYESKNGGVNWSFSPEFGVQFLRKFIRIAENKWILLGHNAIAEPNYMTENSGLTWHEIDHKFSTMQFINENIGYAIDSSLYKTTNGGNTWELINESVKEITYWTSTIFFLNESVGWLNHWDFLYFTNDGGITWLKEYGIRYLSYFTGSEISLSSGTTAWAVGSNGKIQKLDIVSLTNLGSMVYSVPQKFLLYQNYPNPFNPTTIINYTVPRQSVGSENVRFVELNIYDILGNEITTLVNEQKSPGNYSVEFNSKNLTSGVYFYKLSVGQFSETKKMVLLR